MKPGFALVLTHDSIGLMHRTVEGWNPLGEVAFAAPDLMDRLAALRQTGEAVAGGPLACKLVIPASEVLYLTIAAPGPNAQTRRAQIRAALDGRTPYAVKELAFDWHGTGPEVQVAVVARETLAEAEAFADQHGFGPVSLVASPDPAVFAGEPWFGAARRAENSLKPGEKVERGNDPVPFVAAPAIERAEAGEVPGTETLAPETGAPDTVAPGLAASESAAPEAATPEAAARGIAGPAEAAHLPADPLEDMALRAEASADKPASQDRVRLPSQDMAAPGSRVETGGPASPPDPEALLRDAPASPPHIPDAGVAQGVPADAATADLPVDPVATLSQSETAPAVPRWMTDPLPGQARQDLSGSTAGQDQMPSALPDNAALPPADDLVPPPLARSSGVDVLSQALDMPPDLPGASEDDVPAAGAAPAIARLRAKLAESAGDGRGISGRKPTPGTPAPLGAAARVGAQTPKPALRTDAAGPRLSAQGSDNRAGRAGPVSRPAIKGSARGTATPVTSPSIPLPRDRRVNIPTAATEPQARATAVPNKPASPDGEKLGPFGKRTATRGKPRFLGLILTGLLLLVLAAVAAWSSFSVTSNGSTDDGKVGEIRDPAPLGDAASTRTGAVSPDGGSAPRPTLTETPAPVEAATDTSGGVLDAATAESTDAAARAAVAVEAEADGAATIDEVRLSTAGSSSSPVERPRVVPPTAQPATARAPAEEVQDEIFLARADPAVVSPDAVILAPPASTPDSPPRAPPLPPPFGTVYQFDAQGLIVPTAAGIVTPEGVRLVAGRPAVVPPSRPSAVTPAAPAETRAESPAAPPAGDAAAVSPAGQGVAGTTTGEAAAPGTDAGRLAVGADPKLAGARPRARPESANAPTRTDPEPATSEDDAALPVAEDDVRITSPRPRLRPASVVAAAEAERAAPSASLAASAIASDAPEPVAAESAPPDPKASPLAIAVSRKPAARPRDFSAAVSAAVAEAARSAAPAAPAAPAQAAPATIAVAAPKPKVEPAPVAKAAPAPAPAAEPAPRTARNSRAADPDEAEDDEPEPARAAPSAPVRADVARQATFRNAINLSRTNLIGVYGSSANRYALVRQPNGRFVKVAVGDRVDGGRVAAISERELTYVKNGRTVTLSMPKS